MLTPGQKWYRKIKANPTKYREYLSKKRESFINRKYKDVERMKSNYRKWRDNTRKATFEAYGGKCACCGETRKEFLCIDHINGEGNKERRKTHKNGGVHFYAYLRRKGFPAGYRVLCHNCNMSLGTWGYCPHQTIDPSLT